METLLELDVLKPLEAIDNKPKASHCPFERELK